MLDSSEVRGNNGKFNFAVKNEDVPPIQFSHGHVPGSQPPPSYGAYSHQPVPTTASMASHTSAASATPTLLQQQNHRRISQSSQLLNSNLIRAASGGSIVIGPASSSSSSLQILNTSTVAPSSSHLQPSHHHHQQQQHLIPLNPPPAYPRPAASAISDSRLSAQQQGPFVDTASQKPQPAQLMDDDDSEDEQEMGGGADHLRPINPSSIASPSGSHNLTSSVTISSARPTTVSGRTTSNIHLWQFIKELLLHPDSYSSCIHWVDRETGIFKIVDSVRVASLWGKRKNRPAMNYDKLSRSLRQYYKKKIMKKTERTQRLVYQFCHPYHL